MVQAERLRLRGQGGALARKEQAEREPSGQVLTELDPMQAAKVRLWDNVEGAWTTTRFEPYMAQSICERAGNLLYRCSACTFTTLKQQDVETHRVAVRDDVANHIRARSRLEVKRDTQIVVCTACGTGFRRGPKQFQQHLQRIRQAAPLHVNAGAKRMLRFALQPPAQIIALPKTRRGAK